MSTPTTEAVRHLGERWAAAEQASDSATLDELSTADFTLVGPLGFVLDKNQWLARYRGGGLITHELVWDELAIRDYGDAAVVVGRHTQRARFQDNAADGAFRGTHILVRDGDRWRLAGIHLSPIGGPPPFAAGQNRPGGGR